MAYLTNPVIFGSPVADAFGRGRVSNPSTLFNISFEYDAQPLLMQVLNVGAGTGVKTANVSSVTLSTGGNTNGDGSILQSHGYYRYEPGKSQLILMTGIIGAAKANVRSQIGYFDANNGLFFDQNNGIGLTVRTHTSGSTVDTTVAQAAWNIDKLDGTGPSGITLDLSKTQIFVIDLEWLGTGSVRFGFIINGTLYYAHKFNNANSLTLPYMNTACLPLRWEIHNTGTAAGATTMSAICGTIISEGGQEKPVALQFTAGNGTTGIGVTTRRPILSLQPKTTFNSIVNRSRLLPIGIELSVTSNTALWQLVYNGTLTGASFNSADANSGMNFDVAATAITGGTILESGYIATSGATRVMLNQPILGKLALSLDIAGAVADILSLVITSFTGTATTNGQLIWTEER